MRCQNAMSEAQAPVLTAIVLNKLVFWALAISSVEGRQLQHLTPDFMDD